MSQDDPKHEDHLHRDQDEVAGTDEPRFGEQQEDNRGGDAESDAHGASQDKPFGHDERDDESGVNVEGEKD